LITAQVMLMTYDSEKGSPLGFQFEQRERKLNSADKGTEYEEEEEEVQILEGPLIL